MGALLLKLFDKVYGLSGTSYWVLLLSLLNLVVVLFFRGPAGWGQRVWPLASVGTGPRTTQDTPVLGDKETLVVSSG